MNLLLRCQYTQAYGKLLIMAVQLIIMSFLMSILVDGLDQMQEMLKSFLMK